MRGHLGFRVPRAPYLEAAITQLSLDTIEYFNNAPIIDLTQLALDTLEYQNVTEPTADLTQFVTSVLTYFPAVAAPRVTQLNVSVLLYKP